MREKKKERKIHLQEVSEQIKLENKLKAALTAHDVKIKMLAKDKAANRKSLMDAINEGIWGED